MSLDAVKLTLFDPSLVESVLAINWLYPVVGKDPFVVKVPIFEL